MPKLSLAKLERHLYSAADRLRQEGLDAATYKDYIFKGTTPQKGNFTMARMGRVGFIFDCRDCKEKIRLTLYFGLKKIWNNSTSATLQKLYPHQKHKVNVQYLFEPDW